MWTPPGFITCVNYTELKGKIRPFSHVWELTKTTEKLVLESSSSKSIKRYFNKYKVLRLLIPTNPTNLKELVQFWGNSLRKTWNVFLFNVVQKKLTCESHKNAINLGETFYSGEVRQDGSTHLSDQNSKSVTKVSEKNLFRLKLEFFISFY